MHQCDGISVVAVVEEPRSQAVEVPCRHIGEQNDDLDLGQLEKESNQGLQSRQQ